MSDLSRMYDEKVLCEKALTRLRAQRAVLVEALKDAEVAVELLSDLVNDEGFDCDGPTDENFQICGHGICNRIGCMRWKISSIEAALATLDVPAPKEQL